LNSLVQTLYMCPEFRRGLYSIDPTSLGLEQVSWEGLATKSPVRCACGV
jgi:hypothetical protein